MAGFPSNGTAPAAPDAFIDRRSGKPRRITAKVKKAVRLLNTGECITLKAAAERAGLHPDHLSRSFKLPHVQRYIDQATRDTLTTGKMLGAARLLQLIHSKSEHVSFDASVHALGIGGIRPSADPSMALLNVNVSPGYVISFEDPRQEEGTKTPEEGPKPLPAPASAPADHQRPFGAFPPRRVFD